MAVPFRRVSKMKKRQRRSHLALSVPGMITCPNCGELTLSHRVCGNCGFYNGKQVVTPKAKKDDAE
ncbi:MAG: 50S ribosomal protein L32 [Acholeplasmatales bacterium]|nr:50S ribosomal protein L32 [Acholeplasmatales bacterium]